MASPFYSQVGKIRTALKIKYPTFVGRNNSNCEEDIDKFLNNPKVQQQEQPPETLVQMQQQRNFELKFSEKVDLANGRNQNLTATSKRKGNVWKDMWQCHSVYYWQDYYEEGQFNRDAGRLSRSFLQSSQCCKGLEMQLTHDWQAYRRSSQPKLDTSFSKRKLNMHFKIWIMFSFHHERLQ